MRSGSGQCPPRTFRVPRAGRSGRLEPMSTHENLLGGPAPTHLPDDPEPRELLASGAAPAEVAAKYPVLLPGLGAAVRRRLRGGARRGVVRLRAHRVPPRSGRAAPGRLARARPGAVRARAEPRLPACPARPGPRRAGDRRERGVRALHRPSCGTAPRRPPTPWADPPRRPSPGPPRSGRRSPRSPGRPAECRSLATDGRAAGRPAYSVCHRTDVRTRCSRRRHGGWAAGFCRAAPGESWQHRAADVSTAAGGRRRRARSRRDRSSC